MLKSCRRRRLAHSSEPPATAAQHPAQSGSADKTKEPAIAVVQWPHPDTPFGPQTPARSPDTNCHAQQQAALPATRLPVHCRTVLPQEGHPSSTVDGRFPCRWQQVPTARLWSGPKHLEFAPCPEKRQDRCHCLTATPDTIAQHQTSSAPPSRCDVTAGSPDCSMLPATDFCLLRIHHQSSPAREDARGTAHDSEFSSTDVAQNSIDTQRSIPAYEYTRARHPVPAATQTKESP